MRIADRVSTRRETVLIGAAMALALAAAFADGPTGLVTATLPIAAFLLAHAWFESAVRRPLRALIASFDRELLDTEVGESGDALSALARLAAASRHVLGDHRARLSHLEHATRHDALTDLASRAFFEERLASALEAAAAEDADLSLLCLDIDRFKEINDSFGHACGDEVLRGVAAVLREACDGGEFAARVGGDEFTILQSGAAQPGAAERLAERLLAGFERRAELATAGVGVSIGVAIFPKDARDPQSLRHHADLALYRAKQDGRGRARFFAQLRPGAARDDGTGLLPLPMKLAAALEAGDLRLHYQPKLRTRANTIDGVEALIRWQHPIRGLIPPDLFIPVAERVGQIRQLTEWTLAQAIDDQRALAAAGHDLPVYVNISARLLGDAAFVEAALAIAGRRTGVIGFEITETAVIDDPEHALAHLHRFVAAGLKIAIDDYGAGMSSLIYLKQLPAHELKIDRAFVSELTRSHRDPLLVRSTIDLAHALGLEVTAEGVETPAALALLRVMGCDLAQGYLVARPMPLDALIAFMDDPHRLAHLSGGLFRLGGPATGVAQG